MGWISKLFGQCGVIRFDGVLDNGQGFDGTIEIEAFNVSNEKVIQKIKDMLYVKYNWRVRELEIKAFVDS